MGELGEKGFEREEERRTGKVRQSLCLPFPDVSRTPHLVPHHRRSGGKQAEARRENKQIKGGKTKLTQPRVASCRCF